MPLRVHSGKTDSVAQVVVVEYTHILKLSVHAESDIVCYNTLTNNRSINAIHFGLSDMMDRGVLPLYARLQGLIM